MLSGDTLSHRILLGGFNRDPFLGQLLVEIRALPPLRIVDMPRHVGAILVDIVHLTNRSGDIRSLEQQNDIRSNKA